MMHPLWSEVQRVLSEKYRGSEGEYVRIIADGREWRSLPEDAHGHMAWVSWEPYQVIGHFSQLKPEKFTVDVKKV